MHIRFPSIGIQLSTNVDEKEVCVYWFEKIGSVLFDLAAWKEGMQAEKLEVWSDECKGKRYLIRLKKESNCIIQSVHINYKQVSNNSVRFSIFL